ncbi:ABC transporter [Streptomyces longispororuber]|uniref:ABC transporter n=1 Tax=Streptomyces longispororuber TaxID=68230 RepID=A0A918ZPF6_9ACTN|nr:ABC transporter [Streptomyces longispororuber]
MTTNTGTTTARPTSARNPGTAAAGLSSLALVKLEIRRTLRNRKFLFFSVLFPALLFLITAGGENDGATVPDSGLSVPAYLMVSMASFGALTAVLMGNSERIARERESGWVRQLRLTSLPGRGYVLAKTASAAVISLPSILVVLAAGGLLKGVRLDAWQWLALTGAIWAGSLCFAALGVAVGYLANGDTARPLAMILYFTLSVLGGLWMPATTFPHWLQTLGAWLPTHAYAGLGRAIELGGAPHAKDVVLLVAYFALFAAGAAWLYRKDTLKA